MGGDRDREVLDREAGGVEQRHRIVVRPAGGGAREHRAEVGDVLAGDRAGLDGAGELPAVGGLRPLVAEERAAR